MNCVDQNGSEALLIEMQPARPKQRGDHGLTWISGEKALREIRDALIEALQD